MASVTLPRTLSRPPLIPPLQFPLRPDQDRLASSRWRGGGTGARASRAARGSGGSDSGASARARAMRPLSSMPLVFSPSTPPATASTAAAAAAVAEWDPGEPAVDAAKSATARHGPPRSASLPAALPTAGGVAPSSLRPAAARWGGHASGSGAGPAGGGWGAAGRRQAGRGRTRPQGRGSGDERAVERGDGRRAATDDVAGIEGGGDTGRQGQRDESEWRLPVDSWGTGGQTFRHPLSHHRHLLSEVVSRPSPHHFGDGGG
jgi:hypothetical protein